LNLKSLTQFQRGNRRNDHREGEGHAGVAGGIAEREESYAAHLTPSPSPLPGNTSSGFATFSPSDAEKENPIGEGSHRQGDHIAHPAVEGLQKSFRPEEGKGQGHDGLHL